ncbi:MAG: RNB domain-containing ribonuclease [Planctomycetes bacterium]|nr:RNB domain-containing ribonuclease [Planctomycetota bacterium]
MNNKIQKDALVIFKSKPAKILSCGEKFELSIQGGKGAKVREKDFTLIHPGPCDLAALKEDFSQLEEAWEYGQGEELSLSELAELLGNEFSPSSAWSAYLCLEDGLYFTGDIDKIQAHDEQKVSAIKKEREDKAHKAAEQEAFLERIKKRQVLESDEDSLDEIIAVALDEKDTSPLLKKLKFSQQADSARQLLIELGLWAPETNIHALKALRLRCLEPKEKLLEDSPSEENRLDLTHLKAWAIDDEGSKDPDDAISLEGNTLWVHIADVACLVPHGTALDLEARERGANLYLPEWVSPMLPQEITDQLGLGLLEKSPALSFQIEREERGNARLIQVIPSWLKVTRTSYAAADKEADGELKGIFDYLKAFDAFRREQGALELDLPEVKISAKDPDNIEIRPIDRGLSRLAVKNAMLMCGQAVARFALENEIPIPYTHQAAPKELEEGISLDPSITHEAFALRKYLSPSEQSLEPSSHAGLGLEPYTQCTSPLRRYSDLLVHQQLRAYLRKEEVLDQDTVFAAIGGVKDMSRNLRRLERFSNHHWTLIWLSQQEDWEGKGIIVSKESRGVIVLIPALAFEQKIFPKIELVEGDECVVTLYKVDLQAGKALLDVKK